MAQQGDAKSSGLRLCSVWHLMCHGDHECHCLRGGLGHGGLVSGVALLCVQLLSCMVLRDSLARLQAQSSVMFPNPRAGLAAVEPSQG